MHRGVSFAPAPGWAEASPFRRPGPPTQDLIDYGLCVWRVDNYADWLGPEPVHFSRVVQEVISPDGLQGASTFDASFDPSFERLVIHHVRVLRGDDVRELAEPDNVELFRRERDLERARYDGRLTAHLIIPDLRVGDIVDACFSVVGANPVLRKHYGAGHPFQWGRPVASCRFRIYAPGDRKLAVRAWGRQPAYSETELKKGGRLMAWQADGFPPFFYEPHTPPGFIGHSMLLVTDAMAWGQVADLFRDAYGPGGPLPDELEARAVELLAREPDPGRRAAAALRLVQGELRYLTVGIGESGYLPRSVAEIWRTRFGDCKDASRLLAALLQRLGVEACPALVNTDLGWELDTVPPHPRAFDHCIVRARVGGKTFWLDGTRSVQSGRLDRVAQARFGWALALVAGAELEWMGEDEPLTVFEHHDHIAFGPQRYSPADLDVQAVFRSWRADDFRRFILNEGEATAAEAYRDYYEARYGRLEVTRPFRLEDDADANEIRITEGYRLLEPWRPTEDGQRVWFATLDETVRPSLTTPATRWRTMPIALGWPRRVLQTTTLELPAAWAAEQWDERWDVGGLTARCSAKVSNGGKRLELASMVEVRERVLPAELAPQYFQAADKARRAAAAIVAPRVEGGEFVTAPVQSAPAGKARPALGGVMVGIFGLLAAAALIAAAASQHLQIPGLVTRLLSP
jgi:transglutaminase-like putative cysteine protease